MVHCTSSQNTTYYYHLPADTTPVDRIPDTGTLFQQTDCQICTLYQQTEYQMLVHCTSRLAQILAHCIIRTIIRYCSIMNDQKPANQSPDIRYTKPCYQQTRTCYGVAADRTLHQLYVYIVRTFHYFDDKSDFLNLCLSPYVKSFFVKTSRLFSFKKFVC